jgi:lysophospholipase L1-like esterase
MTPASAAWREVRASAGAPPASLRRAALLQITVGSAIAAFFAWRGRADLAVLLFFVVLVVAQAGLVSPSFHRRFGRVLERFGHVVGVVLSVVLLGLVALFVVLPVAVVSWLFRVDLLGPGRAAHPTTAWYGRLLRGRHPAARSFANERQPRPEAGSTWARIRAALAGVTAFALIAVIVGGLGYAVWDGASARLDALRGGTTADAGEFSWFDAPAVQDDSWFQQFSSDYGVVSQRAGYRPFVDYGMPDARTQTLNFVDGERATTEAAGEPEFEVWFIGGSTVFGIGQRDQHTIPSEVVRLAEADGLRIRARNLGVPTLIAFQEALLLAERLGEESAPDLVVMLDGYNDVNQAWSNLRLGHAEPGELLSQFTPEYRTAMSDLPGFDAPTPHEENDDDDVIVDASLDSYGRGLDLVERLGDAHDFAVVPFWQPDIVSKERTESDEELADLLGLNDDYLERAGEIGAAVRDALPEQVIDLSGALDDVEQPVMIDQVHTDEVGARVIAEAMYPAIAERLRASR